MINTIEIFGSPQKHVMDPVHGSIPIFTHEYKIIQHPLFQRLRHILQNDVVFFVYPGCRHNRLLHSLGTMHMVAAMFEKITSHYLARANSTFLNSGQKESTINNIKYLYCCLRMAALLHDTGHAPFSHHFEIAEPIQDLLSEDTFKSIWTDIKYKKYYKDIPEKIRHEHYSVRIAYQILSDLQSDLNIEMQRDDILFFLETTDMEPSDKLRNSIKEFTVLFTPEIDIDKTDTTRIENNFLSLLKTFISGEIDGDKMDYILRDSYFSGIKYGNFNKHHLLNSLRIGYELYKDDTGKLFDIDFSIAIKESGVGALEDFIYKRYQLYHELYHQKSVSGYRKILMLSLGEIAKKKILNEIKAIMTDVNRFKDFTDTYFWEKFREHANKHKNSYCSKLINRQGLKYIGKRVNENEQDIKDLCERLSLMNSAKVDYMRNRIRFSSINSYYTTIKVLAKTTDNKTALKKISKVTDFFSKFDKKEIYYLFELPS